MTFRSRILAVLLLAAGAPLVVLGIVSYRFNRQELLATVGQGQARAADDLAREVERFVLDAAHGLQLSATYVPWHALSPEELSNVLEVPYRQLHEVDVLVLLDASGSSIARPVFRSAPELDPALRDREPIGPAELDAFSNHIPVDDALSVGFGIGAPYRGPRTGVPRVAVALPLEGPKPTVLAAEISLGPVDRRLRESSRDGDRAVLVDASGAPLGAGAELSAEERALVAGGSAVSGPSVRTVRGADGAEWLGAYAPVGALGWGVLVERPASAAFRAADRVQRYTAFWGAVAVAVALALGALLSRGVSRPVARLSRAAAALTEGRYDVEVEAEGDDEIGQFASAFGHMAREVRRRDEEIRGWNAELSRRVEDRTAELRAAQDQIARTRRLAALGSLGAGMAHELNNPLTSVIGLVTLARADATDPGAAELLDDALAEARRVARILADVRRVAGEDGEGGGRPFSLAHPVRAALDAIRPRCAEHRIAVEELIPEGLPNVHGDPERFEELVSQLVKNAVAAMAGGGALRVAVSDVGGEALKLSVSDTGHGIAPEIQDRIFDPFFTTKPGGAGTGLGLSIAHGIAEAHHGKILVESAPGRGACFTVVVPAEAARPHLV